MVGSRGPITPLPHLAQTIKVCVAVRHMLHMPAEGLKASSNIMAQAIITTRKSGMAAPGGKRGGEGLNSTSPAHHIVSGIDVFPVEGYVY